MSVSLNQSDLTKDGIRTIVGLQSTESDPTFRPTLQVISIKSVGPGTGTVERFRTVLSDGDCFVQGMLATQLNHLLESDQLVTNTVVRVDDFMNNDIQGKNVIIMLKVAVLGNADRLGNPIDIVKAGNAAMNNNTGSTNAAPMYNRTNQVESGSPAKNNPYSSGSQRSNPYSPPKNHSHAPIVHRGTTSSSPGGTPITLISQLNMYQNRWTIKARVVSKSDIRTWSNAKGEGSLFSIELLDSSGTDVRATLFKEAVDKFYNLLNVGQVYTIAGGRIKVANIQYNTCKSQYEMTLDQNSEIHLVDDEGEIQNQLFDFVKIADVEKVEAGKNVDILAIVQEIGDCQSLTSKKTGKELQKADLTLVDDTGVQVRLTLWGSDAMNAKTNIGLNQVVAFRRARVSDYGGKSLSGGNGVFVAPKIPETQTLEQWWTTQGSQGGAVKSISSSGPGGGKMDTFQNRKTIGDIKGDNLGYENEKGDYISFKAHFNFLKKDKEGGAWYTACPNKESPCNNRCKVTQTTDGNWQCDRCHGTYPNCNRKWIFSGTVCDDTASTWVSVFDDQALTLFNGAIADDVFAQYENQDAYDGYFAKAVHTEWVLRCRVKNEMVNDEPRLKVNVVRMDPVDYAAECQELISAIEKFQ
jgi:replication factor A1